MAWTTISNAAVAVGAIPSSSTVTALRDNPVAVAESASGAPVVFAGWHPYDKVSVGDGKTGLFYDHSVNGTVAEVVTPDFVDGYEYRIIASGMSHNSSSSREITWEAFRQTSADYAAMFAHTSMSSSGVANADIEMLTPRLEKNQQLARITSSSGVFGGTLEAISGAAINTTQKILKVRVYPAVSGQIDAGKIWLFRRREYASSP